MKKEDEIRQRLDQIKKAKNQHEPDWYGKNLEELIEELHVYHAELKYQNEELQRIQVELERKREEYTDLFENSPNGRVVFDEEYVVRKINAKAREWFHLSNESLQKIKFTHFVEPSSQDDFYFHCQKILKTGKHAEVQIRIKANEDIEAVKLISILKKGEHGENLISCSMVDISIEIKQQHLIETQRNRYRVLYENSPLPYQSLDPSAKILDVNPAWLEKMGYARKEVIGQPFTKYLHPDSKEIFKQTYEDLKRYGQSCDGKFWLEKKDGRHIYCSFESRCGLDANGVFQQSFCTFKDITQQEEAIRRLRESEQRFRLLADYAGFGLGYYSREGVALYFNEKAHKDMGSTPEATDGKHVMELFGKAGSIYMERILQAINTDKALFFEDEITVSGKKKWYLSNYACSRDEQGEVVGILIISNDITEHKNIEAKLKSQSESIAKQNDALRKANQEMNSINCELEEAKSKAEESDRLKSAFLANMSHEIRTPLNAILGFSEIISRREGTSARTRKHTALIRSAGKQLLRIINDVLDISKIESDQLEIFKTDINLNQVLNEIIATHQQNTFEEINNNVELRLNIPDYQFPPMINTDAIRLTQICNNLIGNAIKFTKAGFIELGYTINETNSHIEFYVKDTGRGIETDMQKVIFQRFRQADSYKYNQGNGLGLSISQGLVNLLGGEIWVESQINKGTTFYFTLPYHTAVQRGNTEIETANPETTFGGETIYIAEDDFASYLYIEEVTEGKNLKLLWAKNGAELIRMVREKKPDLILLDINMPVMNGFEAIKILKREAPDIPVVAQTAYAMSGERVKIINAGFQAYLAKPIEEKLLIDTLSRFLL